MEIILTESKDQYSKNPWYTLRYSIITQYKTYRGFIYTGSLKKGKVLRDGYVEDLLSDLGIV